MTVRCSYTSRWGRRKFSKIYKARIISFESSLHTSKQFLNIFDQYEVLNYFFCLPGRPQCRCWCQPSPNNELRETPDDSVAPSELAPSEFNNYLQTRNNQLAKTPLYNQLAKTHSNLEVGKWYAFTIKWTEGAPGDKTPKK